MEPFIICDHCGNDDYEKKTPHNELQRVLRKKRWRINKIYENSFIPKSNFKKKL